MTCDPERLSNYLDGELSPDEERQLQDHLEHCERCAADLAAYQRVDDSIRGLGPVQTSPRLRRALYQRLDERRRKRARPALIGRLLSPAVPVTVAFALVVGSVVVWRQLPPGTAPVMTAAFAVQETPESLDGLRVELVFDRPVAADSVAVAVQFDPPLETIQRVEQNKVELIPQSPVSPGSTYRLTVNNVRDQRGNVQSEPIVLNLLAGPTVMVMQESAPVDVPRPQPPAAEGRRGAPAAAPTAAAQDSAVGWSNPAISAGAGSETSKAAAAVQDTPPASEPVRVVGGAEGPGRSPRVVGAATAATPSTAPPGAPPVPSPVVEPTAILAARTAGSGAAAVASFVQPAASPTPISSGPRAIPSPSSSATHASAVPGGSRSAPDLSQVNDSLLRRLGAPIGRQRSVQIGEQAFQGGAVLTRADTSQVLVLVRGSSAWLAFANTWRPGEVLPPAGPRPPGTYDPMRGIGKVWREHPAVRNQLGWAVFEERSGSGEVLAFDKGSLIRTPFGVVYALFDDGAWQPLAMAGR